MQHRLGLTVSSLQPAGRSGGERIRCGCPQLWIIRTVDPGEMARNERFVAVMPAAVPKTGTVACPSDTFDMVFQGPRHSHAGPDLFRVTRCSGGFGAGRLGVEADFDERPDRLAHVGE